MIKTNLDGDITTISYDGDSATIEEEAACIISAMIECTFISAERVENILYSDESDERWSIMRKGVDSNV